MDGDTTLDDTIRALQLVASAFGDDETVLLCAHALAGDKAAQHVCEDLLATYCTEVGLSFFVAGPTGPVN